MKASSVMKKQASLVSLLTLVTLPTTAFAQTAAPPVTIGQRLVEIVQDIWNPIFLLAAILSMLAGIYFLIRGLMKFVEAAQGGGRTSYGPAFMFIIVATVLISLPDFAGIGMNSVLGSARGGASLGSAELDYDDGINGMSGDFLNAIAGPLGNVKEPDNCLEDAAPATCMGRNVAKNTIPMAIMALFAFTFIAGFIALANVVIEMAKNTEKGDNRGGYMLRLVTAALLMNAPLLFGQITSTILGTIDSPISERGLNETSSLLKYPVGSNLQIVQNYVELIGHSFTILAFFGAWSFIRGIFMVKGVSEAGRQAGSYGMAATYIIAGILMANVKFSTCVVLGTFGGVGMGEGFCS